MSLQKIFSWWLFGQYKSLVPYVNMLDPFDLLFWIGNDLLSVLTCMFPVYFVFLFLPCLSIKKKVVLLLVIHAYLVYFSWLCLVRLVLPLFSLF